MFNVTQCILGCFSGIFKVTLVAGTTENLRLGFLIAYFKEDFILRWFTEVENTLDALYWASFLHCWLVRLLGWFRASLCLVSTVEGSCTGGLCLYSASRELNEADSTPFVKLVLGEIKFLVIFWPVLCIVSNIHLHMYGLLQAEQAWADCSFVGCVGCLYVVRHRHFIPSCQCGPVVVPCPCSVKILKNKIRKYIWQVRMPYKCTVVKALTTRNYNC